MLNQNSLSFLFEFFSILVCTESRDITCHVHI